MRRKSWALLLAASILTAVCMIGCVVDDSDRCLDDSMWSEKERGCIPKPEVSDTDTSPSGDSNTSVDTNQMDTNPPDSDGSGLGETCDADTDCGTFAASYCMKDPMAAPTEPGECTIQNCTQADCGTEYACCDCTPTFITWPTPVCAPNGVVSDLTTLAGCTCQESLTEPEPELGLGESCADDSSCASYTANYCMKDPMAADTEPGECTIQNCTQADCGTEYTCCDCTPTFITWPTPVCAPNGAVGDLTTLAGCTCEGGSK